VSERSLRYSSSTTRLDISQLVRVSGLNFPGVAAHRKNCRLLQYRIKSISRGNFELRPFRDLLPQENLHSCDHKQRNSTALPRVGRNPAPI